MAFTVKRIDAGEFEAEKVSRLPDRPNASPTYGGAGLSANGLKAWFDKTAVLLCDKLNEVIDALNGGDVSANLTVLIKGEEYTIQEFAEMVVEAFSDVEAAFKTVEDAFKTVEDIETGKHLAQSLDGKETTKAPSVAAVYNEIEKIKGHPIVVRTAEEMDAVLETADENTVGAVYKYAGETTEDYTNGELYVLEENAE